MRSGKVTKKNTLIPKPRTPYGPTYGYLVTQKPQNATPHPINEKQTIKPIVAPTNCQDVNLRESMWLFTVMTSNIVQNMRKLSIASPVLRV